MIVLIKVIFSIIFISLGFIIDLVYIKRKVKKGKDSSKIKFNIKDHSYEFSDSDVFYGIGEITILTIFINLYFKNKEASIIAAIITVLIAIILFIIIHFLLFNMRKKLLKYFQKNSIINDGN